LETSQTIIFYPNIVLFLDKALPDDLFGYWHLSDDLILYGQYRTFKPASSPDPTKLANYGFIANSPVPSFTGKFGLKFDGYPNTVLLVPFSTHSNNIRVCYEIFEMKF